MKLLKLSLVLVFTFVFLASSAKPADARLRIKIKGNAVDTTNKVNLVTRLRDLFNQNNKGDTANSVNLDGETGENKAEDNTGGSVTTTSGNIGVDIKIKNEGDYNDLAVSGCCEECCEPNGDITIKNNGDDSTNEVKIKLSKKFELNQQNGGDTTTSINIGVETGENKVEDNTNGDINVTSGNIDIKIKVKNEGDMNVGTVNTCCVEGTECNLECSQI